MTRRYTNIFFSPERLRQGGPNRSLRYEDLDRKGKENENSVADCQWIHE